MSNKVKLNFMQMSIGLIWQLLIETKSVCLLWGSSQV